MATIEVRYSHGEEKYVCSECEEEINEALIEDYIYEKAKRCPSCGELIEDVDIF